MIVEAVLKLMKKYGKCPKCGNETLRNGQGTLIIEDKTFTRTCNCGFIVTVNENDEIIE